MNPWNAFVKAVDQDPAAPRLTFYDRTPGPTQGERIELSGKVLLNWASKAANLLAEEFDIEPGSRVAITLPASHWRTVYWCLAAWAAGACVEFADSDLSPTNAVERSAGTEVADVSIGLEGQVDVLVTLAALARSANANVPSGALDEARDLATFGDQFVAMSDPDDDAEALPGLTFAELAACEPAERAYLAQPTPERIFAGLIGGGVMLVRGEIDEESLLPLLQQEALRS